MSELVLSEVSIYVMSELVLCEVSIYALSELQCMHNPRLAPINCKSNII